VGPRHGLQELRPLPTPGQPGALQLLVPDLQHADHAGGQRFIERGAGQVGDEVRLDTGDVGRQPPIRLRRDGDVDELDDLLAE